MFFQPTNYNHGSTVTPIGDELCRLKRILGNAFSDLAVAVGSTAIEFPAYCWEYNTTSASGPNIRTVPSDDPWVQAFNRKIVEFLNQSGLRIPADLKEKRQLDANRGSLSFVAIAQSDLIGLKLDKLTKLNDQLIIEINTDKFGLLSASPTIAPALHAIRTYTGKPFAFRPAVTGGSPSLRYNLPHDATKEGDELIASLKSVGVRAEIGHTIHQHTNDSSKHVQIFGNNLQTIHADKIEDAMTRAAGKEPNRPDTLIVVINILKASYSPSAHNG